MLALVAAALGIVTFIGLSILSSRNEYFQQRNLRELDRVAAELNSTGVGLAQTATLHFVPQQLHFSLSAQFECLVATTEIMGARQQPMQISYYFTDTEATRQIAAWYADQTPRSPPASSPDPPQIRRRDLPDDICGYERPLGLPTNDTRVQLTGGQLRLERTAPLRGLLWPMSTLRRPDPDELSACVARPKGGAQPEPTDLRSFIRECIFQAATEDMADQTYSYRQPDELSRVIRESIDAAMRSNAIRINVSTPIDALDFDSALEHFDAIQIIGSDRDHNNRPILIHQVGRVPAEVEGDEEEARFAAALAELTASGTGRPPGTSSAPRSPRPGREGDFLGESRIVPTGDLILFQRTVPSLAGLYCNPCRIVGIVEQSRFNQRVRRIDGVHATIFLIATLSLIGLIPLLQLRLRRRLDAAGRVSQYITWFSLTLLAASTAIAGFAAWASAASRNAGAEYSGWQIHRISTAFDAELRQSLQLIAGIGAQLPVSPSTFPSPRTLPTRDQLDLDWSSRRPQPDEEAVATLARAWSGNSAAAILDTVSYFRRDGYLDRQMARVAASRFPAFGTTLSDRSYFRRAKNRDFDSISLEQCDNAQFVMDRVFSRPDGAPRIVWVMPAKQDCRRPNSAATAANATALRDGNRPDAASAAPPATPPPLDPAPVFIEDTGPFYDPTGAEFLVSSGSLRTFLGRSLQPGFHYAVVDPDRPAAEANILFHSNPRAELVERFEREIDDPAEFFAMARQALARHGDESEPRDVQAFARLRMDTNYRAKPTRLTVARLHPNMDWLLIIIEDRDDASYSVWRAATFGYGVWFFGALVATLILFAYASLKRDALDRRPGLSLWPRKRLQNFTPPRLQRHAEMRRQICEAARRRDRHIWWVLGAGFIGIVAAEGASRVTLAFAAVLAAFAARAYFEGLTAAERGFAKRLDRWAIALASALLLVTILVFVDAIWADLHLRAYEAQQVRAEWVGKGRALIVLMAVAAIGKCLYAAWSHIDGVPAAPEPSAGRVTRMLDRLRRWQLGKARTDIGWMAALFIIGGLPAAAGFLDSYDQDRTLHFERKEQILQQAVEERRQAINAINISRLLKLPDRFVARAVNGPHRPTRDPPVPRPDTDRCTTLSCLAIFYLDLHEDALEFSDSVSFHMLDVLKTRGAARWVSLPFLILLPLLVLFLVLLYFHRQYFNPPPSLSPGKDPDFDPPLSFTRQDFTSQALLPAARGEEPVLPFKPAGGKRHLILGIGMDLRDEWAPDNGKRLADAPGIEWIDLLDLPDLPEGPTAAGEPGICDPAATERAGPAAQAAAGPTAVDPAPARVVVIGNLDLALQVQDEGWTADKAFRAIKAISDAGGPGRIERHVFLLADIDPLDRIALLWEQQDESASLIKGWRWAELLEDFTLFPIRREDRVETESENEPRVEQTIREELGVLDIGFAHELCGLLIDQFKPKEGKGEEPADPAQAAQASDLGRERADAERIISFISEQMSDYYQKLWASSSDEERVILYRIARDCHLKMPESRAVRSLLARGLLIRVPEYRLLNRSFTRYVCRIGASSRIQRAADNVGGLDHIWPLIRYPLAALAAAAVVLLQVLAPAAPTGATGLLPALLALVPALLGKWFQDRGGAT